MSQGVTSDRVRELQARLAQIGWFHGTPTGHYGPQTRASVSGFQSKRGLAPTGAVDQTTWDRLVAMTRTPTSADLTGAMTQAPKPVADPVAAGSEKRKAQGLDPRCMSGRVLCVSKKSNRLWWLNDGVVVSTVDVRFGSDEFPTRNGSFKVTWKSRDHVSSIYKTPMPFALFYDGGRAVHYSPDFAGRGYQGYSHGCVNVRDKQRMKQMFDQVRVGDKVVVYS